MKIYTAQMMAAAGTNVADGVVELEHVNGAVTLGILWFTSRPPNALFASAPAQSQLLPPEIRSVPNFANVGNGGEFFTVVEDQQTRRGARVEVLGVDPVLTDGFGKPLARTFHIQGWITSVDYHYQASGGYSVSELVPPIQYHFAPSFPIRSAPVIPDISTEADFAGACILLKASDYRGERVIQIAGFGTAYVIGLWDEMTGSGYSPS